MPVNVFWNLTQTDKDKEGQEKMTEYMKCDLDLGATVIPASCMCHHNAWTSCFTFQPSKFEICQAITNLQSRQGFGLVRPSLTGKHCNFSSLKKGP